MSAASRDVRQIDYRLAKIDVERRSFVDYQAIEFHQRSPYTNSNPVPDCIVYEYGTIYRILLGTYKYKQNVTIFRNASPLCIETLDDGRFSYYAGGFRTRTEAEKAVEVMAEAPRRIFNLGGGLRVGEAADIAVFDLESRFTVDPETFLSKGRSTPFEGWELQGECCLTLVDGRVAYEKR